MANAHVSLDVLLTELSSPVECAWLLDRLSVPAALNLQTTASLQSVLSQALGMLLFLDLTQRVPDAKHYTDEQQAQHRRVMLDHGALRTVRLDMAGLPSGRAAFSRILEPLGYREVGEYPLPKLRMCGFVYQHGELPAELPQYFVSELYPEAFSDDFQATVKRVVGQSPDPLHADSKDCLTRLRAGEPLSLEQCVALLNNVFTCFARQHALPSLHDYQRLKNESAEMAWIATEGNAFNHATDRVTDLNDVARGESAKGRPMKPFIEEGRHASIRQTAYRATPVKRAFRRGEDVIELEVPGSFFEFIERGHYRDEEGNEQGIDLRFDSSNAQGIFKMTAGASALPPDQG